MKPLQRLIAAHPLTEMPYSEIAFVRVDGNGAPLYTVGEDEQALGARSALRAAIKRFGGRCFHCGKKMLPDGQPREQTLDHLRSRCDGGEDVLHNLVFSCRPCNRRKGATDLISFKPEAGSEYLKALDEHLVRCLKVLNAN